MQSFSLTVFLLCRRACILTDKSLYFVKEQVNGPLHYFMLFNQSLFYQRLCWWRFLLHFQQTVKLFLAAAGYFRCCVQCECCKLLIWCWSKHMKWVSAIFHQSLVLNTCFSVLWSAVDTVSWFLCPSIVHSIHIQFWSVRQKTSRGFSCFWQIISCSRPVASVKLCLFPLNQLSCCSRWCWQ